MEQDDALAARTESISHNGRLLVQIVRAGPAPSKTTFVTDPSSPLQIGYVVYPAQGEVPRHIHLRVPRTQDTTSEVLLIQKGRCLMDVFDENRAHVATRELSTGDVVLLVYGGHGFRLLEDTVFLEIKQGPYTGLVEKERF